MDFLADPTPHEGAVSFLKGLPTVDRETFDKLPDEFKASAFLITGIKAHDVLQDVRDLLAKVPQGEDFEKTRQQIAKRILPHMGGNDKAAQARSLIIARAWTGRAYNMGIAQQLDNHTGAFPFRKRLSVEDSRVRPSHAAMSGLILPAASPFWQSHTPPDAFNCRCFVVGVTRRAMQRTKDADDAAVAAGTLEPDKVRVLEGPMLAKLETDGVLIRGVNQIYALKDEPGATQWNPKTLLMPIEEIQKRYDPQTWNDFENWSKKQIIGGESLYDKLAKQRGAPAQPAPAPAPTPTPTPAPTPAPAPAPQTATPAPVPAAIPVSVPAPAPSPVKPASTAKAVQVAAHVDVQVTRGTVKKAADEALAAIAKVHSDGGLKLTPLISKSTKRFLGAYMPSSTVGRLRADPFDFDSSIAVNPKSPHPVMTVLHETGHKIDFEAITYRGAIKHPAAYQARKDVLTALKATPQIGTIMSHSNIRFADKLYLTSDEELFARSYAQYIAGRSGNKTALSDLAADLATPSRAFTQWPDADFAPILPLFDQLFTALGWAV